jgi:hypothetical protein
MRTRRKLLVLLLSAGTVLGYAHGIHSLKRCHRGQCGLSGRGFDGSTAPFSTPGYGGYAETDGSSHPGFSPLSWFGGRRGHGHGHHGHGHGHGHHDQAQGYAPGVAPQAVCGCAPPAAAAMPIQMACPTAPAAVMACPQPIGAVGALGALGGLAAPVTCAPAGVPAAPVPGRAGIAPGLRDPFAPAAVAPVPYPPPR